MKVKIFGGIAQFYTDKNAKNNIGSIMFDRHEVDNHDKFTPCKHRFYMGGQMIAEIIALSIA